MLAQNTKYANEDKKIALVYKIQNIMLFKVAKWYVIMPAKESEKEKIMAILFNKNDKTFTLHTKNSTYQMKIDSYDYLLHLYYGARTEGNMEYLLTFVDRGFSGNPYEAGEERTFSLDVLPQEYPTFGAGEYRSPALIVKNTDGSYACDLRYFAHRIKKGKYGLPGLPAVYANEEEAETLEVIMEDQVSGLKVSLLYGVLPEFDIITRSVVIKNEGQHAVVLEKVQSACLDMVYGNYDLISFYGRYAMERNYQRCPVGHGAQVIGSRRGFSSHQYSPLMILADHETNEDAGKCYAMSFVYSGGFKGEVERDHAEQTRMQLGLMDEMFEYPLDAGETFYAPEVVMSHSKEGLNRLSQNLHECYRTHLCRGKYKDKVRPILVNSWEAVYFDVNGETIYQFAKDAAEVGIEMVVMDDGWFGTRNSDKGGLGDWYVNEEKLGMTLGELISKVNSVGVKFGIWIEPESISEDSDLYKEHPDWAFVIPGRKPERSRSQLILDFSRKEVVDTIFEKICAVLDQGNIEYVKWDINRSIGNMYSHTTKEQGKVLYDYMLGVYDFMERLITCYPDILLEGCGGGGGRMDAGILYYSPQIWCSDNTDAIDRVKIQYGSSFGFPISSIGSHVSDVPNHYTGRITSLKTRGTVAMAGTFGYELNVGKMTDEEKEEVKKQIREYHKYAELVQKGLYYRLANPYEEQIGAWEVVSKDGSEALVSVVMLEMEAYTPNFYVKVKGLTPGKMYQDQETKRVYPAEALMDMGFPIPRTLKEYDSYQMHLKVI